MRMLLGLDDELCTDYAKEERVIQHGVTKCYKEQDKPPDGGKSATQTSVKAFYGLDPNNNNPTVSA
eukprot:15365034-Ditylum_brightwellii.AAC.1